MRSTSSMFPSRTTTKCWCAPRRLHALSLPRLSRFPARPRRFTPLLGFPLAPFCCGRPRPLVLAIPLQLTWTAYENRAKTVVVSVTTDHLPNSGLNLTRTVMVDQTTPPEDPDATQSIGVFYLSVGIAIVKLEKMVRHLCILLPTPPVHFASHKDSTTVSPLDIVTATNESKAVGTPVPPR